MVADRLLSDVSGFAAWLVAAVVAAYLIRGLMHYVRFFREIRKNASTPFEHLVTFGQIVFFWPTEVRRTRHPIPSRCDRCNGFIDKAEMTTDDFIRLSCSACGRIRLFKP